MKAHTFEQKEFINTFETNMSTVSSLDWTRNVQGSSEFMTHENSLTYADMLDDKTPKLGFDTYTSHSLERGQGSEFCYVLYDGTNVKYFFFRETDASIHEVEEKIKNIMGEELNIDRFKLVYEFIHL